MLPFSCIVARRSFSSSDSFPPEVSFLRSSRSLCSWEHKKDKLELEKQIEQAKQNAAEAAGSEIRVPDQPSMDTSYNKIEKNTTKLRNVMENTFGNSVWQAVLPPY